MKIRPIFLIISTLIIGFILGMLVSAQIRFHKLKPVRFFFSEEMFREGFFNLIQPDDRQAETIDFLLSKYAKANGSVQGDFRRKTDSLMKEFWKELEPKLTKEQIDRLKEMDKRRDEMIIRGRRNQFDSTSFRGMRRMQPPPDRDDFERRQRRMGDRDSTGQSRM